MRYRVLEWASAILRSCHLTTALLPIEAPRPPEPRDFNRDVCLPQQGGVIEAAEEMRSVRVSIVLPFRFPTSARRQGCHILRALRLFPLTGAQIEWPLIVEAEVILEIDPPVYLRADRGTAWERRGPKTIWEDHQQLAERLEGTSGPLCLDGARPHQKSREEYHPLVRPLFNPSLAIG